MDSVLGRVCNFWKCKIKETKDKIHYKHILEMYFCIDCFSSLRAAAFLIACL